MSTRGTTETGNRGSDRHEASAGLDQADLERSCRLGASIVDAVDRVVAGQRDAAEMAAACCCRAVTC